MCRHTHTHVWHVLKDNSHVSTGAQTCDTHVQLSLALPLTHTHIHARTHTHTHTHHNYTRNSPLQGIAYVEFENEQALQQAVALNGSTLPNCSSEVSLFGPVVNSCDTDRVPTFE